MLRPTLLLSATLFAVLLIAGRDHGQLRPGLAAAEASGQPVIALSRSFSPTVAVAAADQPVKSTLSDLPPPVELIAAPTIGTLPEPETALPEAQPVFTLSALPGLEGAVTPLAPQTPAASEPSLYADPSDGGRLVTSGTLLQPLDEALADEAPGTARELRVVQASSANVRLGPSTDSEVVGRLYGGEVVQVVGTSDSEWVEVSIEGDGIHGFVAARLLLPVED